MLNRVWRSGTGPYGKHGRHARLYTTAFTLTRPSPHLDMAKTVPPEVRRAVRDVAAALRGAAEALTRLDDLMDDRT